MPDNSNIQTVDREVPPPAKNLPATQKDTQKLDELLNIRGLSKQQFQVLAEAIHPNAQSAASVMMAFDYCKARGLDPFKRSVHIVPVWSKKHGKLIETVWMGIGAIRIEAHRTKEYAGCDDCEYGPDVTRDFKAGNNKVSVTYPEWAKFNVYRIVNGEERKFVGPKVRFLEYYATEKKDSEIPNDMWRKRPYAQLEKCAESAALNRGFPESADTSAEEMEGQVLNDAQPASRKEQMAMQKEVAESIAQANTEADRVVDVETVEDDAPPPVAATFQEKMQAAARVAEATGQPESVVKTFEEAGKPGITTTQANALMKHAVPHGWSTAAIVQYFIKEFGVEKAKWQAQITDRQYQQAWDYFEANKPEG